MDTADSTDPLKIAERRERHKARGINGNGFGVSLGEAAMNWPTAQDWRSPSDVSKRGGSQPPEKRAAGGHTINLEDQAEHWATPQARDHFPAHSEEYIAAKKAQGHGMRNLNDEAANWMSPKASDPEKAGPNMRGSKGDLPLPAQAANWAGPAAQNHKGSSQGSSQGSITRQDGKSRADILSYQAEQFFHPPSSPAHPTVAGGALCSTDTPNTNQPSVKRKLNPIFVEALMRWPTGLSGFERPAMAWTLWWQLQLGFLSTLFSEPTDEQMSLF